MTSIESCIPGSILSCEQKNGMDFKQKNTKSYIKKCIYLI